MKRIENVRTKLILALVPILVLLIGLGELASARELSSDRLSSLCVGAPSPYKCCMPGALTPCRYSCVTNPNCPANVTTYGACGVPACQDIDDQSSYCSPPTRQTWVEVGSCTTTGQKYPCFSPPNTEVCGYTPDGSLSYVTLCNSGDTLCPNQPSPICN